MYYETAQELATELKRVMESGNHNKARDMYMEHFLNKEINITKEHYIEIHQYILTKFGVAL